QEEVRPEHLNFPLSLETGSSASVADGTIAEVEWRMILDALRRHGRNKTAAAKALGISLRTLYNKLEARGQVGPANSEGSISTQGQERVTRRDEAHASCFWPSPGS